MKSHWLSYQDQLETIRQTTAILHSTLLCIYLAQQSELYEASMYADAIHGCFKLAQELLSQLQQLKEDSHHDHENH